MNKQNLKTMEGRKAVLDSMEHMEEFNNKIVIIGCGATGAALLPMLLKIVKIDLSKITVIDMNLSRFSRINTSGINVLNVELTQANIEDILIHKIGMGKDDILIDCSYYMCTHFLHSICAKYSISYTNSALGTFANNTLKYEESTYYAIILRLEASDKKIVTKTNNFIVGLGCNPGNVNIWTMYALEKINNRKFPFISYADLAQKLGLEVIHISEKDSQITKTARPNHMYMNTWAMDGKPWYGEAFTDMEISWGTHEKHLPVNIIKKLTNKYQYSLNLEPIHNWANTYTPISKNIRGMLIPHEECVMITRKLSIKNMKGKVIYKPSCYFIYKPCDNALASTMEISGLVNGYYDEEIQPQINLMTSDIISGCEELGCTLMFSNGDTYWIGSLLDIHEARYLYDNKFDDIVNATIVQVVAGYIGSILFLIKSIKTKNFFGLLKPEDLPIKEFVKMTRPLLGPFGLMKVTDWKNKETTQFSDFILI
jgi:homospermidine synthase